MSNMDCTIGILEIVERLELAEEAIKANQEDLKELFTLIKKNGNKIADKIVVDKVTKIAKEPVKEENVEQKCSTVHHQEMYRINLKNVSLYELKSFLIHTDLEYLGKFLEGNNLVIYKI